jgi:hypothetical protein
MSSSTPRKLDFHQSIFPNYSNICIGEGDCYNFETEGGISDNSGWIKTVHNLCHNSSCMM